MPGLSACIRINTIKAEKPPKSKEIRQAAVLWYSQSGNTQKCGKVLAKTFEKKGVRVTYGDLRDFDKLTVTDMDLIVIGSPVFYYDVPGYVKNYIRSWPDLNRTPVAAYVTFGGPEGNQHNAACAILECLAERNGVPVGLATYMTSKTYPPSFEAYEKALNAGENILLPNVETYKQVREFAGSITFAVENGQTPEFTKTLTLREFSTYFSPAWWTKQFIDNHYIVEQQCVECGVCVQKCPTDSIDLGHFSVNINTCVLCFGCLNNCEYQAVNMEYGGEKLIGFHDFQKKNNLNFILPAELKS